MLVSSVTEEFDHARYRELDHAYGQTRPLEQGQIDRHEAAAQTEARLGNSNDAPECSAGARSGAVQFGNR
jgi:hypothetical protein